MEFSTRRSRCISLGSQLAEWIRFEAGAGDCRATPSDRDMIGMKAEEAELKPGDSCPLCGKGTLVPSPSGANLLCWQCNRIIVDRSPQAHLPKAKRG